MCLMAREPGFKDSSLAMHIILKNCSKTLQRLTFFFQSLSEVPVTECHEHVHQCQHNQPQKTCSGHKPMRERKGSCRAISPPHENPIYFVQPAFM